MLRSTLLYLSKNKFLKDYVMNNNFSKKASRRFVAGETLEEAIDVVKILNSKNLSVTLDCLGENVSTRADALKNCSGCLEVLGAIKKNELNSNISLKLTALGIDIDEVLCNQNLRDIVKEAEDNRNFIRVDMEDSNYVQRTIDIYLKLKEKHNGIGIVLQSCLYRTEDDVNNLIELGNVNLRLVKGAYKEPENIAFQRKKDVDNNYIHLTNILLNERALKSNIYTAFATHDERIIDYIKNYVNMKKVPYDKFEFQMLYGIRKDLQEELSRRYKVRVYVPFGTEWYPYFMRRLAERPANLWFLLKNLLR